MRCANLTLTICSMFMRCTGDEAGGAPAVRARFGRDARVPPPLRSIPYTTTGSTWPSGLSAKSGPSNPSVTTSSTRTSRSRPCHASRTRTSRKRSKRRLTRLLALQPCSRCNTTVPATLKGKSFSEEMQRSSRN